MINPIAPPEIRQSARATVTPSSASRQKSIGLTELESQFTTLELPGLRGLTRELKEAGVSRHFIKRHSQVPAHARRRGGDLESLSGMDHVMIREPLAILLCRQVHKTACVSACLEMLGNYLEGADVPESSQIDRDLRNPHYRHLNKDGLISAKSLQNYFNGEFREALELPFTLEEGFSPDADPEVLISELMRTRRPILLPYMADIFSPDVAEKIETVLSFVPGDALKRLLTGGSTSVYPRYLHLGVLIGVASSVRGEHQFMILDPWDGLKVLGATLSAPSPGLDLLCGRQLRERWGHFHPGKLCSTAQSSWRQGYFEELKQLVRPGSFFTLEEL